MECDTGHQAGMPCRVVSGGGWSGQEGGGGVDQGSHSEGKGTKAALKGTLVSWWETSTVPGRSCKGELQSEGEGCWTLGRGV